uniref:Uncharacterized protein n=1 Tax=Oryza brachyantha TaxID=4533 RepID=J3LQT7_ORYBR
MEQVDDHDHAVAGGGVVGAGTAVGGEGAAAEGADSATAVGTPGRRWTELVRRRWGHLLWWPGLRESWCGSRAICCGGGRPRSRLPGRIWYARGQRRRGQRACEGGRGKTSIVGLFMAFTGLQAHQRYGNKTKKIRLKAL